MTKIILIVSLLAAACSSPAPSNRAITYATKRDPKVECISTGIGAGSASADTALCTSNGILHWCHGDTVSRPDCEPIADLNSGDPGHIPDTKANPGVPLPLHPEQAPK